MGIGTFVFYAGVRAVIVVLVFSAGLPLWMRSMGANDLGSRRELAPVNQRLIIGFVILIILLVLEFILFWTFGPAIWGKPAGLLLGLNYTGILTLSFALLPPILAWKKSKKTLSKGVEEINQEINAVTADEQRFAELMVNGEWVAGLHMKLDKLKQRVPGFMAKKLDPTRKKIKGLQDRLGDDIFLLRARRSLEAGDMNSAVHHVLSWNKTSEEALLLHLDNQDYTAAQSDLQAGCAQNEYLKMEAFQLLAEKSGEGQRAAIAENAFRSGVLNKRRYAVLQLRQGNREKAIDLMSSDLELRHWTQALTSSVSATRQTPTS